MPPRRRYSNQEYLEMVLCYRECNSITAHAVNLYQQRFGVRVSHHTILDAVYRFKEHGRFDPPPVDAGRPRYSAELEEEVLDNFRRHPRSSTRDAARVLHEDSSHSETEIKVFCPKCRTEVLHTAEGIQEDQTKILIAKVYHYFEQEYEELKKIYGDLDLTPLSKFRQRTALATGVSESTVLQILQEEEGRNADKRQGPLQKRRRARKRSIQTDSSSETDSSDDNADDSEESSNVNEPQMLVVKEECPDYDHEEPEIYVPAPAVKVEPSDIELNKEQAQTDPISLNVKTEPRHDVVDDTNETLALNEPAATKRKGRKISRKSDVTSTRQHTQGESSTTAAARTVRLTEQSDESDLIGDTEMKAEEIEIHEGVS